MRIAIAGSTGLIGSALTQHLRRSGHEVVRLVRSEAISPDHRRWDPLGGTIDGPGLSDVDAVVNLAGSSIAGARWTEDRKRDLRDSRVRGTRTVVRALEDAGRCRVFLSGSAVGIYGNTGSTEVDESTPPGGGFLADLCQQWEQESLQAPGHVRIVQLRTGHVLSRTGGLLGKLRPAFLAGVGGRIGDGEQYMSWISLTDHVAAMTHLLTTSEVTGPVDLTGPHPVTNLVLTQQFAQALRRPAWVPLPLPVARAVFGDEMVTEAMLYGQRALPTVLLDDGFVFTHQTVREALDEVA